MIVWLLRKVGKMCLSLADRWATKITVPRCEKGSCSLRLIFDLDGVIANTPYGEDGYFDYLNAVPCPFAITQLRHLQFRGHRIIICTARFMKRYNGSRPKATEAGWTLTKEWLTQHNVPHDELLFGKTSGDAYFDDRAVRVSLRQLSSWQDVWDEVSRLEKTAD